MSIAFRYRSEQILDIVRAEKRLRNPQAIAAEAPLPFKAYGTRGRRLDLALDLADGPLLDLALHVRAGIVDAPTTYEAVLILDGQRVRGVGYTLIEQTRWYRIRIPKGWHQNIIDPNLQGDGGNRHEELPGFAPADLDGFFLLTIQLWNISIPRGGQLL
jgi:hypothetical protein